MTKEIKEISFNCAKDYLLPRHYSGRIPAISKAFGWFIDGELKAVVTFGKPASPMPCRICGKEWIDSVYELNRLCRDDDLGEQLSEFVGGVLRILKDKDWIIISYSDTAMHHSGYIYQACNFIYSGKTKERTDMFTGIGKHPRHFTDDDRENVIRVLRSAKHRYVYFCTHKKGLRRKWLKDLTWPQLPYPKEQNENYRLGDYIKPTYINKVTGVTGKSPDEVV